MTAVPPRVDPLPALRGRRVTFVLGTLSMGGAERQALQFARYLMAEQGAIVRMVGLSAEGEVAAACDATGIPWELVRFRWPCRKSSLVRTLPPLAATLRRGKPDALLAYTTWANVGCGLIWRFTGARVCIWNQRSVGDPPRSPVATLAARLTPVFQSNSLHAAAHLAATLRIARARIRVIPNGVALAPPQADRDSWRARLGLTTRDFAVGSLAHFRREKDHETLLRAWRLICNGWPADSGAPVLLLAGRDGGTADSVRARIDELGLAASVRVQGEVADVSGFLGALDLAVLSTHGEGLPNAVLESMASGLAVLATDVDGVREAVGEHAVDGLVPPGDVNAWVRAIRRAAADGAWRTRTGESNRTRAAQAFAAASTCHASAEALAVALARGGHG